ncbi:predicted protein [Arabidopsis lyrata subsp. lyrata]|uniref:Predicted protein n=1 Tax=Arabidopsis lyrata subsp. lyrata TaxID=81972 RepID=D7M436_ARALL|nr:predicted protein [Arabidopsis lyrata subsp. lyrata]
MDCEGVLMPLVHEHLMMPWNDLRKGDCCGLLEAISVGYYCKSCDFFVHKKCDPPFSSSKSTMDSEGVLRPLIHDHLMMPWNNDLRKGDCCGRFEATSDGYYCKGCHFFVHKTCGESPKYIEHPSHPAHTLQLLSFPL